MAVGTALTRFDAPGRVRDLDDAGLDAWSEVISNTIDDARAGDPERFLHDAPRAQFFNELTTGRSGDDIEKPIEWIAFPRIIQEGGGTREERLAAADADRNVQDEYC